MNETLSSITGMPVDNFEVVFTDFPSSRIEQGFVAFMMASIVIRIVKDANIANRSQNISRQERTMRERCNRVGAGSAHTFD